MKNGLLCFSVILLISGCQSIQKTLYGIKQPRVENPQTVSAYLKRHKTDTTKSVCFKDFHSFIAASKHKMLVIPDAMFFNKDGAFVPYRNSAEACNAKVDVFLKDLARFNEKPFESHKNLELFSKWINDPSKITKSDVTVIITWTRYAGRLNKEKAFEWIKLLEKAKANGTNVEYYLLNCDVQESWNLSAKVLEEMGIKS